MAVWTQQSDDDPLFRIKGHPIYVTELLILVYSASFIILALAHALRAEAWLAQLPLETSDVLLHGKIWQVVTYPLINPLSPWFAIEMVMLFWFGREVERSLGHRAFGLLYLGLTLFPSLVLLGITFAKGIPVQYAGSQNVHFAIFLAFALLFPRTPLYFGNIQAQWVAAIFVALLSLIRIANHDWIDLAVLWTSIAVTVVAIRVPFVADFWSWQDERRERKRFLQAQKKIAERKLLEDRRNQSIDPILEKISRHGMQSLNKEERERLERARIDLLKRDQKR